MFNLFRRRVRLSPQALELLDAYAEALVPDVGVRLTRDQAAERLVTLMLGNDNLLAVLNARLEASKAKVTP